ncbi:MAG TPA: YihY/virulence factor BrkB family protein [Chitinophagaceae bacterium]|nr:YihY/virulence factor BrkB family protein [Chitinophagaceae bacterium]
MRKIERILNNLHFVRFIRRQTQRVILPGSDGITLHDLSLYFWKDIQRNNLGDRASAISWNFMLAIPPTFIFLFTLLPFYHIPAVESTLYSILRDISPNQRSYTIITGVINDFLHTQRKGLLSLALLSGYFFSTSGVQGILRSFDRISPVYVSRNSFQRRWAAIKITALLLVLVIICILLIIAQGIVFKFIFGLLHIRNTSLIFWLNLIRWLMIFLMFFCVISLIYRFGPSVKKKWRIITAGSALSTLLMILSTLGFSYFVRHFNNYNKIYGSVGSVMVLMLWVYFNSMALLIGFDLNMSILALKEKISGTKGMNPDEKAKNRRKSL